MKPGLGSQPDGGGGRGVQAAEGAGVDSGGERESVPEEAVGEAERGQSALTGGHPAPLGLPSEDREAPGERGC